MKTPGSKPSEDKNISSPTCTPHTVPREQLSGMMIFNIDEENSRYYEEYKKLLMTAFCIDK